MKRKVLLVCFISYLTLILGFNGCSKDNEDKQLSVSGTKWSRSVSDGIEIIAFLTESDCQLYSTKSDGTLSGSVMDGRYSIEDDEIVFSQKEGEFIANLTGSVLISPTRHQFKTGKVSGEFLSIIAASEEITWDYSHYSEDQHVSYTTTIKEDVKYTFKKDYR